MTRSSKYPLGVMLYGIATAIYLSTNHFHLFEPRFLPMAELDRWVPFVPWTYWIYMSEYLLFALVYIACDDLEELNKYLYSFLFLQVFANVIFLFWPTTYPRELFPLPDDLGALTRFAAESLRRTDSPANCCPSLHVSSVYLSSFVFIHRSRAKFVFFFLWATAVAVTTLTTKQHYAVDVVTGFICAILVYWLFHVFVKYYRWVPFGRTIGVQASR